MQEMSYNNSHNNSDFGNLGLFFWTEGVCNTSKGNQNSVHFNLLSNLFIFFKPNKFRSEVILEDWNLATRLNIIVELTSMQSGCHAKVSQQVIW